MKPRRRTLVAAALSWPALPIAARHAEAQTPGPSSGSSSGPSSVQPPTPAPTRSVPADMVSIQQPSFVVEFRIGPNWDPSKKPTEQAYFRDHSANLKQLRDGGHLIVGARYSDKGWIAINAESERAVRAMVEADPSVQNGIFVFEIHPLSVFYAGCLQTTRRGP